ncbi:hypothetical protein D3C87_1520750 [compost metagenome]
MEMLESYRVRSSLEEENRKLPLQVDEATTLVSMSIADKKLTYNYKLTITKSEMPDFKIYMQKNLDRSVCSEGSKRLSQLFSLAYSYRDKNNEPMESFEFPQGYCP